MQIEYHFDSKRFSALDIYQFNLAKIQVLNNPKLVSTLSLNFRNCDPIKKAQVEPFDQNEIKPHYLNAHIEPKHLSTGEPTSVDDRLARRIRKRGIFGLDDCGHIVARSLGGKMLEFNLFPQNKYINRGWSGFGGLWRICVENLMKLWLENKLVINPRIDYEIVVFYNDAVYPHRPDNGLFKITFLADREEEENENNDANLFDYPVMLGQLENTISNSDEIKTPNFVYYNFSAMHHCGIPPNYFHKLMQMLLDEFRTKISDPSIESKINAYFMHRLFKKNFSNNLFQKCFQSLFKLFFIFEPYVLFFFNSQIIFSKLIQLNSLKVKLNFFFK